MISSTWAAATTPSTAARGGTLLAVVANCEPDAEQHASHVVGSGTTTFTNIAAVSLTGGTSNNSFDVGAWTGNPVQINGGGGSDTLVSKDNTDFTLTDTSLARSDGAKSPSTASPTPF